MLTVACPTNPCTPVSRTDYDNPWKEALARYLPQFLELCYPDAHAGIDWSRGYRFLDQELRQVTRRAAGRGKRVDVLAQVWTHGGEEAWVLIHIEIQSQRDEQLPKRVSCYYHRLIDRYDRPVATFVVLADVDPSWRPNSYGHELWGCSSQLCFPTVKLLDLNDGLLAQSRNPIAVVIQAHRRAQATQRSPQRRLRGKIELVQDLYSIGLNRDEVRELLRLVDWFLNLPQELEKDFWLEVDRLEDKHMPYVMSIERLGMERGRQEALQNVIIDNLALNYGAVPEDVVERVRSITNLARLNALVRTAFTAGSLDQFQRSLEA